MNKEKLKQIENFLRVVARVFYEETDLVVMDTITHLYFVNFVFETKEVSEHMNLPDKTVRSTLLQFKKSKLILEIKPHQLKGDRQRLNRYVTENYKQGETLELWEFNKDLKEVVAERLIKIEQMMQKQFESFDKYTKVCRQAYCKKEFKTEEYSLNPAGKCPSCGEFSLEFKYSDTEAHNSNTIPDKQQIDHVIASLKEKLQKLDTGVLREIHSSFEEREDLVFEELERNNQEPKESNVTLEYKPKFVIFGENFFEPLKKPEPVLEAAEIEQRLSVPLRQSFTEEDIKAVVKKLLLRQPARIFDIAGHRRPLDDKRQQEEYRQFMSKRVII